MGGRSEFLLDNAWRRAHSACSDGGRLLTEKFLEDALAAALEYPEIVDRVIAHLRFRPPPGRPRVITQAPGEEGRPDITLEWDGERLELELKIGEPPSDDQIARYLAEKVSVAAIARLPGRRNPQSGYRHRFLGVFTWRGLRGLTFEDPPLAWRQLCHLIDVTEVAVPEVTLHSLTGMMSSWDIWDTFDKWSWNGTSAVQTVFNEVDKRWVFRERRFHIAQRRIHRIYAYESWIPALYDDCYLRVYCGLCLGRPKVCVEGVPDLYIALNVKPDSTVGTKMRTAEPFSAAVHQWQARTGRVVREFKTGPETWDIVRARESATELLHADDQGSFFVEWMEARAREWKDDGVLAQLAELTPSVPTATATGTGGPDVTPSSDG
jgi:hypothetical protein